MSWFEYLKNFILPLILSIIWLVFGFKIVEYRWQNTGLSDNSLLMILDRKYPGFATLNFMVLIAGFLGWFIFKTITEFCV